MVQFVPQAFEAWYDFAKGLGFTDFMSAEDGFRTSLATGKPWINANECGVYFWIADGGEAYVGETVNARGRLIAHLRRHPDIRFAGFQPVPRELRKAREKELIKLVEASVFPTRNIKLAFNTRTFVPFDHFINPAERSAFLQSDVIEDDLDPWQDLPLLTQKQAGRFRQFDEIPEKDEILEALVSYLWSVLPRPRLLENRFWSVTLFPRPHILRVNAGQQEIFTIQRVEDGQLWARVLTLHPFGEEPDGPMYATDSYVDWVPLEDLGEWLSDTPRLLAARELAIQLMRHSTALNNGSHCPQVVRAAWDWHIAHSAPSPGLNNRNRA